MRRILKTFFAVYACTAAFPARGDSLRLVPMPQEEIWALERVLDEEPGNPRVLRSLTDAMSMNRPEKELYYARRLKGVADSTGDEGDLMFALFHMGYASIFTNRYDSAGVYLRAALEIALRRDDPWGAASAYNGLGIYTVNVQMDYRKAVEYFLEGLRHAEGRLDKSLYSVLLGNLAITYYLRGDPSGLRYGEELYEYGMENGLPHMIFSGSFVSAALHFLLKNYDTARRYIERAEAYGDDYSDRTGVHTLYGNILHALGRDAEARNHYLRAREHIGEAEATSAIDYHTGYGEFLLDRGESREAVAVLREGVRTAAEAGNTVNRHRLYRDLSEAYSRSGDWRSALECYEAFHADYDSIFNIERERSINEMRVKYESERKEKEIRERRLQILREERKLQVTVLVLVIIMGAAAGMFVLYRRKNFLYTQIVRQHREAVKREQRLREQLVEKSSASHAAAGRDRELFGRLEGLMKNARIYRRADLNADKLAEAAESNRTYVSRAVNDNAGTSVTGYINSYRLAETVSALSDPSNDAPLKAVAADAGFASLRTFYKLFRESMGMPPSKFREKAAELEKGGTA